MMKKKNDDDTLRLMVAYLCIAKEAEASLERKVEILDRFDLSDAQIAQVCGAAPGSVRNARFNVRRRRK
jgi:hypothetical protein